MLKSNQPAKQSNSTICAIPYIVLFMWYHIWYRGYMEKRIARLLEQVERTQNNCSLDDIARLLEAIGYEVRAAGSSHHVFRKPGREPISVPRAKPVKRFYVKTVLAAVYAELRGQ